MLPSLADFLENRQLDQILEQLVHERQLFDFRPPTQAGIEKAILERQYVGVYYADDEAGVKGGFRLIEPLVYGTGYVNHATGEVLYPSREYLRAFVIKDSRTDAATADRTGFVKRRSVSKSERTPFFRLLRVDRIKEWTQIPRKISKYRELYNPEDQGIGTIRAQVWLDDFPGGLL